MIKEYWTEGKLEDLLNYVQPTNYIVDSTAYNDTYKTPVLTAGKTFILGYTNEENNIFTELPVIIFDDFTTATKYVNFKFKVKSSAMKILVPTSDEVNVKYVYYYMQTIRYNVDTHKRYWISIFSKLNISIAPLPEQRAIVAKIEELFSELDSGIDSLNKAKKQLEVYRQAVLKAAFEGKLTKEWRKENNYSIKYLEKIKKDINEFILNKKGQDIPRRLPTVSFDELPEIPFGWLWVEAHKVCQSVRDGTHDTPKYEKTGIPLVTSKNLKDGDIDLENVSYISISDHREISKRSKVEEKDILFGMIGTIGSPVIVKEDNIFSIKNVGLFKKNETLIKSRYLYYYLSSWFSKKIMSDKELIRGTTQKFISLGGLRMLPTPLPLIDEQEEIIKEIESRLSVCENIEANIEEAFEKAEALRHSILKKAFEGKLLSKEKLEACKQEDDWEPAEKLLKRIKEATKEAK
ncbi:restriction endonuclease subunit S [Alkalibaculum bacchi]|uniref:restriction endonuclease subunit S n=1 Tax=Alkalibaculum bacchi TaxID=645887 RepID=UPI0026F1D275|nr:restriction endonuclease subunit S [Alkalibaculum bacchi]